MRLRWLDPDMTEAIITRGLWWWKQRAHVQDRRGDWHYLPSGEYAGDDLSVELRQRQGAELERRAARALKQRNWQPVRRLPAARIARRP